VTSMAAALASASAAHLRVRRLTGSIAPQAGTVLPAVRVMREPGSGRATVIIPTRNRLHLLKTCIESIGPALQRSGADLMVIDNDSGDPETLDYLAELAGSHATIIRVEGPFNFARLNNRAAELATTEFLCLLNNDIEASDAVWLDEMLSRAAGPDVGAVGAKLVYPSGIVQHAGVVLGPNFAALHAFNNRTEDDPGYCDLLRVARECSAVTAACMVTRRSDYLAVDGMDEVWFPVNFNDVDYCLKLRAAGKRILWTPHARLVHAEGASRGAAMTPERARLFERELASLRLRWGAALVDDPFYSPVLSLDPIPFSALAWPPRKMNPRLADRPRPADAPAGF
jgi:GT2 family glycosyltransferase